MFLPSIKIPWQVYACAGVMLVLGGAGWKLYDLGQDHKQAEWDESIARGKVIVEGLKKKQLVITTRVETVTVEKIKTIKEKGDVIVQKVKVFVPDGTCELPGSFRLFHDAAATNTIPDASEIPNAEPVPASTVASTVAQNYTTCHAAIANLSGLQEWLSQQHQLYQAQCKAAGVHCSKDMEELL